MREIFGERTLAITPLRRVLRYASTCFSYLFMFWLVKRLVRHPTNNKWRYLKWIGSKRKAHDSWGMKYLLFRMASGRWHCVSNLAMESYSYYTLDNIGIVLVLKNTWFCFECSGCRLNVALKVDWLRIHTVCKKGIDIDNSVILSLAFQPHAFIRSVHL